MPVKDLPDLAANGKLFFYVFAVTIDCFHQLICCASIQLTLQQTLSVFSI